MTTGVSAKTSVGGARRGRRRQHLRDGYCQLVGAGAPASWRCTFSANASTSGQRLFPAAGRAGLGIEHVLDLDVQIQLARCLASSRPEQARLDLKSGAGSMVMR